MRTLILPLSHVCSQVEEFRIFEADPSRVAAGKEKSGVAKFVDEPELVNNTSVREVFQKGMKIEDPEAAISEAELVLLNGNEFHLQIYHPFRPLNGWLRDIRKKSSLLPADTSSYEKIGKCAENWIKKSLFTDLVYLHSPSQVALGALRTACRDANIVIDSYVEEHLGDQLQSTEEVKRLLMMLDEIEAGLRHVLSDETHASLNAAGNIFDRARKFWGKLSKHKKKKAKKEDKKDKKDKKRKRASEDEGGE